MKVSPLAGKPAPESILANIPRLVTGYYALEPDPAAPIISGSDVGFRVDRQQTQTLGRLTGTWVVRVNGQWVEPAASLRGRPLGTR